MVSFDYLPTVLKSGWRVTTASWSVLSTNNPYVRKKKEHLLTRQGTVVLWVYAPVKTREVEGSNLDAIASFGRLKNSRTWTIENRNRKWKRKRAEKSSTTGMKIGITINSSDFVGWVFQSALGCCSLSTCCVFSPALGCCSFHTLYI